MDILDGAATALEIGERLEKAIRSGALAPGDALPTIRNLAEQLGVNSTTVANAYRQLQTWGLVHGDRRRGTRVIGSVVDPVGDGAPHGSIMDLASGRADPALLPDFSTALMTGGKRTIREGRFGPVSSNLRIAAARRLSADGISAAHLTVVGGALDGIERVLMAHTKAGDKVALEDPCFSRTLSLVRALGLMPEPVKCDDAGMIPVSLDQALRRGARVVIVTPRAQNPTGSALTFERASQLKGVLDGVDDALIVEDDHAALIVGVPAISLVTEGRKRWAVVRSFAKAFGADFRLAILVGDETTVSRVERRQQLGIGWVSHILQETVAEMLSSESIEMTLNGARETYSLRRDALVAGLQQVGIPARGRSGFNVWVPVIHETEAVIGLRDRGYAVLEGDRFRISTPSGVRVTTSALRADDVPDLVEAFTNVLGSREAGHMR
ncbi:aminotransferase class I/II-fold pyridoxal phosphate-dependent enzyme [Mycobacterium dioxanotrophicus]|uniref:aminotransferase class I/II-fold pyridoxal phosphate-dependent enzyme n=1 Tax=Mycobacterium dioxanotrophicus TaxID=482462 RepID=UPI0018DF19C5|nr:aminotransferase class I/II-fold pyridoxal phosphate-dependent enzyme [Mycobacterium dioxanotrophicus]